MASYIQENLRILKEKHYVRVASSESNYWFDFTSSKLHTYQKKYEDKFCLILHGSKQSDDAYIFPYQEVKSFFSDDLIDHRGRWIGSIRNNIMRISNSGQGKSFPVSRYYNAFRLLHNEPDSSKYLVKESEFIKTEIDEIDITHLKSVIKAFNDKYVSVVPEKKIVISEQVSRPGLITDYLKQLQNYSCQLCMQRGFLQRNNTLYIEAHHIMELHKLIAGSFCSDNIVVVCPTCHKKLHYADVSYKMSSIDVVEISINGFPFQFKRNIITNK